MKTSPLRPVTRMFPIGTAGYNSRWLAALMAGTSLLGGTARATLWDGSTSTDWNDPTNWVGDAGTAGSNAEINTNNPRAVISANIVGNPVDILVGNGGGVTGRLDHTAGTAATGGGNWMLVGRQGGGVGVYNLANTAASGGILTTYGPGTGSMTVGGRLYVGGANYNGSIGNGTVNVNTSGTLAIGNDLAIGSAGGTGVVNFDAGTINTGGWNFYGKVEGDVTGGDGTFNMSGGTLTNTGRQYVGQGNTTGRYNQSGGTATNNDSFAIGVGNLASATPSTFNLTGGTLNTGGFSIGGEAKNPDANPIMTPPPPGKGTGLISGTASLNVNGELWVGNEPASEGSFDIVGGTIMVNNWVVVGRNGGTGVVTMSGGSLTKTGGGNFAIGNGTSGTVNMTGGTITANNEFWVGQAGGGIGRLNISAGSVTGSGWMAVGREGSNGILTISGTGLVQKGIDGSFEIGNNGSSVGVVNLDGGTLRVDEIVTGGGANSTFNFNGGRLKAVASVGNFMQGLTNAFIKAGGALVDTDGFNVSLNQSLQDDLVSTGGGVTKAGAGTLTLGGVNLYSGLETVSAGTLFITTNNLNVPNVTVANGAGFGVVQSVADALVSRNNVTFGTNAATQMNFNLGNFPGNTTVAPLKVTGTLRLNGPVSINIIDVLPEVGSIPLISYTGPKAGTGTFVIGTLPNGVVGTLSDFNGLVSLNITSVALPYWNGTQDNVWNTTTPNWINLVGGAGVNYQNGNPVLFDDTAAGAGGTDVALNTTVTPASVTFNNSGLFYSLSGTGKISGGTGLTKQGTSTTSIATLNDYTGVTTLSGGTLLVNALPNALTASPIGAASAAPANLVFNGGALEYTGPSTSTNRGFTLSGANSTLSVQNELTSSGMIANTAGGGLIKGGQGNLILTNSAYTIGSANPGLRVAAGTLTFAGGGTQTVMVNNDFVVGSAPEVPGAAVLQNTTLNVGGWIAIGRGNGSSGVLSTFSATNSTITSANFSAGYDNNLGNNDSDQTITLNNSNWTTNGVSLLGESLNTTVNMTVSGTSQYQANDRLQLGLGQDSVVNLTIENSGSVTKTGGWLSIGNSNTGIATVTLRDSARLTADGDFNIGDVGTSQGTLNIAGSAVVSATGVVFVGKNTGTVGTLNMTGGTFNTVNYMTIGRFVGGTGVVNLNGGTITQTNPNDGIIVGEAGTGTLNVNSGSINIGGNALYITADTAGTGNGTVNLNGGTVTAKRVAERENGAGNLSTINFNGGLLVAGAGANPVFMNNLDSAFVQSGGAFINTNGNNIAIDQPLLAGTATGGLTKSGAGTLQLNGGNTYQGPTIVSTGTLGGTGSIAGALTVAVGGAIAPGAAATGTFVVGGPTVLSGTYACEINGAANDTLAVSNTLNVSAATLAITTLPGGVSQPAYVIATYTGATPAPFAAVTGLPPGYAVNYAYNDGATSTNVAIVTASAPPVAYTAWISTFFPGSTDPAVIGTTADPDKDGESNALEFALGGAPNSGTNNAKIYTLAADSDGDVDTTRELLMTIAVRTGTPAFTGSPAPSATLDGFTISAQGGSLLSSFPTAVTPVGVVATGLPTAPAGYQYRTFSLSGSNGLAGKGFIRARVAF